MYNIYSYHEKKNKIHMPTPIESRKHTIVRNSLWFRAYRNGNRADFAVPFFFISVQKYMCVHIMSHRFVDSQPVLNETLGIPIFFFLLLLFLLYP